MHAFVAPHTTHARMHPYMHALMDGWTGRFRYGIDTRIMTTSMITNATYCMPDPLILHALRACMHALQICADEGCSRGVDQHDY